jgi:hypothetical protein
MDAPLAALLELEMLDGVGDVGLATPASASARSSSFPAGPTKGLPAMSSWSPGCSPTSASSGCNGPSPGTARVPPFTIGGAPASMRLSWVKDRGLRNPGLVGCSTAAGIPP